MAFLRERVGQLFMLGFTGTAVTPEVAELLATCKPGGVILFSRNLESVEQIVALTNDLERRAPRPPLLVAIDQEGGRVCRLPAEFTIFPACRRLARCESSELAYAAAAVTAAELRAVGITMNMAPVLDVDTNPANPIIGDRSFGGDPELVCELGLATVFGLQNGRVVACGKHFPGHGDTAADSHLALPVVAAPRERLEGVELRPFRAAVARGLAAVMTAHVLYPALDEKLPATLSPAILTGLLRQGMTFDGLVLTDDLEMRAITDHYGVGEAAVRAIQAGADILLVCKDRDRAVAAVEAVERAVTDGAVPEARIEDSLRRIARVKERFLLPYRPADLVAARAIVGSRTHRALRDQVLRACERRAPDQA